VSGAFQNYAINSDNTVQFFLLPGGVSGCTLSKNCSVVFSAPAYWSGSSATPQTVYVSTVNGPLYAFPLTNGLLPTAPSSLAAPAISVGVPSARTAEVYGYPGFTPAISASGTTPGTAIVWALDNNSNGTASYGISESSGPAILGAYDATSLKTLYSSAGRPADAAGNAVKFTVQSSRTDMSMSQAVLS